MTKVPNYVGDEMIHVPVPMVRLAEVYALLGGASGLAIASVNTGNAGSMLTGSATTGADVAPSLAGAADTGSVAQGTTSGDAPTGEVDAAGTVFDPARHTGTKVKSGLWRMKTGMSRPESEGEKSPSYVDPNAGPATTGAASTSGAANGSADGAAAGSTAGSAAVDEDDEFAAFTAAANAGNSTVKARTWSDSDLSKLTNQAAQKMGSADKVRETIAKFVPAGETPHSRNILPDQREPFAQAIEAVAGIEYAG